MMLLWSPKFAKIAVAACCGFFIFGGLIAQRDYYYYYYGYSTSDLLHRFGGRQRWAQDQSSLDSIYNETLGFEKIFAVGLKERTDRHDFLALAASLTGFRVEWLDGVRGDGILEKALPEGFNLTLQKPAAAGCWRAHMNALLKIVENRYSTALIMEDDADWDISIKPQLTEFARGVHALTTRNTPPNKQATATAPYGANWDMLWVGGCASGPGANETEFYAIANDPTVPAVPHRGTWGGPLAQWTEKHGDLSENSTRYIYRAEMGCCLYGYAVTYEGARKILASLSLDHLEKPVDNALSDMCGGINDRPRLRCFAPYPNIIGMYRQAGSSARDSDIDVGDRFMHGAEAWNLVYSTRMNIHRLVAGQDTVLSQWKDDDVPWSPAELNVAEFQYPAGVLVSR